MLNQIVLVGRLVKNPELRVTESGKKMTTITLAVPRNYKNSEGQYDTDFLDCTLWTGVAENTTEYCQSGDMLGVKGRIQTRLIENEDGSRTKKTEIVAEKVTFLASSSNNKEKKEEVKEEDTTEKKKKVTKQTKKAD
jgi:single-strand DNA-binding protein